MAVASGTPGVDFAQALLKGSEAQAAVTPMDELLAAAGRSELTEDQYFRLLGRLWALKRHMYYVYGSWAMGLNVNEYPASVAYFLSKQIYDDSTHEMQYVDEMLRRKWARSQGALFDHAYCGFPLASRIANVIFVLRGLANFAQNIRVASLNLGAKVVELAWLERFGQSFPDPSLRALFASQVAETRSHVQMGRLIVERFLPLPVDQEIAKQHCDGTRKAYLGALEEINAFVMGRELKREMAEAPPTDVD